MEKIEDFNRIVDGNVKGTCIVLGIVMEYKFF